MNALKKFFSYLLKVCLFQYGEIEKSRLAKLVVRLLEIHLDLPDLKVPLTFEAQEYYIHILEEIGGIRSTKNSLDGLAQIDYMILTYDNVKQKIEQRGGKWTEIQAVKTDKGYQISSDPSAQFLHMIYAENESSAWKAFFNTLSCFGWEKVIFDFHGKKMEAFITHRSMDQSLEQRRGCFLRCHSPGSSYGMNQKYIGKHLGIGKDLCLFNYRGTHKSSGTPSEGGYYLDVESIFQELVTTHSYKPSEIWVTGFCLGGAVAAHLKKKYHDLGLNYIGENTFTSLENVIANQIWPANHLGKWVIASVQSADERITSQVRQDNFNTIEKFQTMKFSKSAISIFISTDADLILPKDSGLKLFLAAQSCGPAFQITHVSRNHGNPHSENVFNEKKIWDEYVRIIR